MARARTVGVDIIEIERIAYIVERFGDRFLQRVYTAQELDYCQGRIGSLAARWAAKEAVSKALGTGIGDISWQDIEVISDNRFKPTIRLHGAAATMAHRSYILRIAISLSHTREHAIAFVVAE